MNFSFDSPLLIYWQLFIYLLTSITGFFVIDNWFLLFDEKCDILSDSCS